MPLQNFMESDAICLNTVDSYLNSLHTPKNLPPEMQMTIIQNARDRLYSDIVQRIPTLAPKILSADMAIDDKARALFMALSQHALDPVFITILMKYLTRINQDGKNQGACLVTGALLARIADKHILDRAKPVSPKEAKKEKKEGKEFVAIHDDDLKDLKHLQEAISILLGDAAARVSMKCGNISSVDAMAVAAAIAVNNEYTLHELINSGKPITADVLDIIENKNEIMKAALLLEKKDFPKLDDNQTKFVESLKRWVFEKLDKYATTTQSFSFLMSIYGLRPDTNKYLINIRDCGTEYTNLLQVVKCIMK